VNVKVDSSPGAIELNDIKCDVSLDLSAINLPVDNSLVFVGEITSTLEYNHLVDQNGNNVYDCDGEPCFGPGLEDVLVCNGARS
jgi:hypothetical protein